MFNSEHVEQCYAKIDFLTKCNFYRPLIFTYFSHPLNYVTVSSAVLFHQECLSELTGDLYNFFPKDTCLNE